MDRIKVVQACLEQTGGGQYLEIGVAFGWCLAAIRAARKIGVDPRLRVPGWLRKRAESRAKEVCYFEQTSDAFFAGNHEGLARSGLDVVLIDGLHTYEQSLRDVENSLRYLREGGVIVMHDCNPRSPTQAAPAASYQEFWKKHWPHLTWCGDVWKTIAHLRSTRSDLDVAVLNCDFGVGVIRRGAPAERPAFSPEQVRQLTYQDLARHRRRILNLRSPQYLGTFLGAGPEPPGEVTAGGGRFRTADWS